MNRVARWLVPGFVAVLSVCGQDMRSRLKGLVYETEDWTTPVDAWVQDRYPPDRWCLWTKEQDVRRKRSGGQSLKSPHIAEDRGTPEDGAPVLHTHITGIPNGLYQVWMNHPARYIALSFDGETWKRFRQSGEQNLGIRRIADGTFDLWVDDRWAFPENPGSCYYDYIRFEEVAEPVFRHLQAHTRPDGRTQLTWITDSPVPTGTVHFGPGETPLRTASSDVSGARNHRVLLPSLAQGEPYRAQVRVSVLGNEIARSETVRFVAGERAIPPPTRVQRIPLSVAEPTAFAREAWPVTTGIPFARGHLADARHAALRDAAGQRVPAQFETLARWPDGSVRWLLLDARVDTVPGPPGGLPGNPTRLVLTTDPAAGPSVPTPAPPPVRGFAGFALPDGETDGEPCAWLVLADGTLCRAAPPTDITVETAGPLRLTTRAQGHYRRPDGAALFRYDCRLTTYPGRPFARLQWTIGNDQADEEFTLLRSAGLTLGLPDGADQAMVGDIPVSLRADTAVTVLQDYDDHYAVDGLAAVVNGERHPGFLAVHGGAGTVRAAVVRDFWQTYPKGIRLDARGIRLDLLPQLPQNQYANPTDRTDERQIRLFYWCKEGHYMFKRGMQVTAEVWLVEGDAAVPPARVAAQAQSPLLAAASPDYLCATGAFWNLHPHRDDEFPRYTAAFDASFSNLERGRVARREYGWMNYGDWWGERAWNWGNSEYDLQYVCALRYAQTGRLDVFRRGDQMARHNTTVDIVHDPWTSNLRELQYAHSVGHVGGFFERDDPRITNRTYSMRGFIAGARDGSGGHTFQGGNFLYGFMTGERAYLEAAELVCRNQAETYTPRFTFGIERSAGWSLYNAMSAYESTLDPFFLNAARIYLEKVFELQDPDTGGWRMRQGPPECDCPDAPHTGGKAFAAGVLLHGLIMVDRAAPDPRVKASIVRGADWLLDHSWNEDKQGFRYKTGCPKYANHGWYTTLVTEGIAYAHELTGDERYKTFLLRTLPGPLGKTIGSGPSSGKSFASNFRHLPHTLWHVRNWGVTALPVPPPPPRIHARQTVVLGDGGSAIVRLCVDNPRDEDIACRVVAVDLPAGVTLTPAELVWEAPPGVHASPEMRLAGAVGAPPPPTVRLRLQAGEDIDRNLDVDLTTAQVCVPEGDALGFVGPADHYSLLALREVGTDLRVIDDALADPLSPFSGVVVGSDVLQFHPTTYAAICRRLAAFAQGGGRVVFLQINDSHWSLDCLPCDLVIQDENGAGGAAASARHPLLAGVDLRGVVCYDTVAFAGPEWRVLFSDDKGRPAILECTHGAGRILVVEPSFDRWTDGNNTDVGIDRAVCRRAVANLAAWLKAE